MQNTMKKLTNEASNTPTKPNAFNLPKCTATTQSASTNTDYNKSQPKYQSKYNRSLYGVRLPANDDLKNTNVANPSGHFVSSSHSKAASTMGIMNFGTAYSSVVAAANRGCLNNKFIHPHPPPQAVIPKTFPVSSLAGGEVIGGGNTLTHPTPPPGLVAISPQNVGLGLPFHKYYNVDQPQQRRGANYLVQDSRYGIDYSRISGIYEWASRQQSESGFSVCAYYSPSDHFDLPTNPATGNEVFDDSSRSNSQTRDKLSPKLRSTLNVIDNVMHKSKENFSAIFQQSRKTATTQSSNGPFLNKLSGKSNKNCYRANIFTKNTPKWENMVEIHAKPKRSQTTDTQRIRKRKRQPSKPLPVLKLYSLSHRHAQSLAKCRNRALAVSCPLV